VLARELEAPGPTRGREYSERRLPFEDELHQSHAGGTVLDVEDGPRGAWPPSPIVGPPDSLRSVVAVVPSDWT
jgi:hypothetical protein